MKKAFTIVELMVVVVIIVLVAAIMIPAIIAARDTAKKTKTAKVSELAGKVIDQAPVVPIKNNNCIAKIGELQKIILEPSIAGAGTSTIYVRNLPAKATLQQRNGKYLILWEPTAQTKHNITVITVNGDMKDEVEILIEAY